MVNSRDLYILRRNYPRKLVGLVKSFIQRVKQDENIDNIIKVEEDNNHYEVWWLRAVDGLNNVLSQTYLGRIKKNYVL